ESVERVVGGGEEEEPVGVEEDTIGGDQDDVGLHVKEEKIGVEGGRDVVLGHGWEA
ncbi:hypothetical protein EIP91_010081, partial [Steccherinum ochraceum]